MGIRYDGIGGVSRDSAVLEIVDSDGNPLSFVDTGGKVVVTLPEGGGSVPGTVIPTADSTGVTVDDTTYDDNIKGSGKLTTLVFPADAGAIAIAIEGDDFPRWILPARPDNYGLVMGDGTFDPTQTGAAVTWTAQGLQISGGDAAANSVIVGGALIFKTPMPTADPLQTNAVWLDDGVLTISAGP